MISIFPIVSNTLFGLLSVDPGQHDLFTLRGASRWTRLWKLQLPAAMPAVFTGFRIAAGLSVIGAVVGEQFFTRGGKKGVGRLLVEYASRINYPAVYGCLILAVLLGIAVFIFFGWLQQAGRRPLVRAIPSGHLTRFSHPPRPRPPEQREQHPQGAHMKHRRRTSLLAIPVAAALVLAACGGDDDDSSDTTTASTEASTDTTAAGTDTTAAGGAGVSLAGDCPETVVIQTDWNPEAEHGFLYQMVGPDDYEVDTAAVAVRGSLIGPGGEDTGVDIEVRSGGPAIGFQTVTSQLYADEDILLGYVYTDEAIQNSADFPTVAIESGFEKNPQMIMWDPATYPDVETIADLGKTDAVVRYFGGAAYMEYFIAEGILDQRSTARTTAPRRCSSPTRARPRSRASARLSRTPTRTRSRAG